MVALIISGSKQVCYAGQQGDPAQVLGQSAIADLGLGIAKSDLDIPKYMFNFCTTTGQFMAHSLEQMSLRSAECSQFLQLALPQCYQAGSVLVRHLGTLLQLGITDIPHHGFIFIS